MPVSKKPRRKGKAKAKLVEQKRLAAVRVPRKIADSMLSEMLFAEMMGEVRNPTATRNPNTGLWEWPTMTEDISTAKHPDQTIQKGDD